MPSDPYAQWKGAQMDEDAVADLLEAAGWGILSLADDDEPYSIPVSFGYAGEDVYFALIRSESPNRKFDFIEDGARARLLVTDVRAKYDWRSVAVTGPVRAVQREQDLGSEGLRPEVDDKPDQRTERGRDWALLLDALEENAWFSTDYESDASVSELQGWRIEPDEIRGVTVRG